MTLNQTQRSFIAEIKEKIRLAQYEALKAVNTSLIGLYWDIGRDISDRQGESAVGSLLAGAFHRVAERIPRCRRVFRVKLVVYGPILYRVSRC